MTFKGARTHVLSEVDASRSASDSMSGTGRGNLRLEEVRAPNEVSFDSHRGARLQASFPRSMTPRRTKAAATARNGSMNSDTLAPNGMSPLRMPTVNA